MHQSIFCGHVRPSGFTKLLMVSVVPDGVNETDICRPWREDQCVITTVGCFWLKSHFLSCVRPVASSLSSNNTMLVFTERTRRSTFRNNRHLHWFRQTFGLRSEPSWLQNYRRNAAAGLTNESSWCRWTDVAVDRCLAWFQAKRHRWRIWWLVAQTPPHVYSCQIACHLENILSI